MKLVIEQELAQQCLNAIAKLPYQDVFQIVPKLLQLPILPETVVEQSTTVTESTEVKAAVEAASTQTAQDIAASN